MDGGDGARRLRRQSSSAGDSEVDVASGLSRLSVSALRSGEAVSASSRSGQESGPAPPAAAQPALSSICEEGGAGEAVRGSVEAEQAEWLLFTPSTIDPARCMARTFAHGKGGQCPRKQVGGGRFCRLHVQKQAHGAVDGPVPEDKLLEFRRSARLRAVGSAGLQASGDASDATQGSLSTVGDVLRSSLGSGDVDVCPGEVGGTTGATSSCTVDPLLSPPSRREDMRPARQSRVVAPRRTSIATMGNVLAENKFVEHEMKRRDFQMRDGQWVDGLLLPGDPTDDAQLELFLRRQFQAQQEEARVAALGRGRALGRR